MAEIKPDDTEQDKSTKSDEQAKPDEKEQGSTSSAQTKADTTDANETYGGRNHDIPDSKPDDELTVGQYIDRHFSKRRGRKNYEQLAEDTGLDVREVVDIVKQLGYELPDGA